MTSIREAVRQMLQRERSSLPDHAFSYRMHWAGVVQTWEPSRRRRVLTALRTRTASADFVPTEWERRFVVRELDDRAHAGSSLLSLIEVLQAYSDDQSEAEPGDGQPPA
jgi:hypothetical protein